MDYKDKKIKSLTSQKAFAFAVYYAECKERHLDNIASYVSHKKMYEDMEKMNDPPYHIITELKEMYVKEKKCIDCPICLEVIEIDDLVFSSCLHKYCGKCYKTLLEQTEKKCAVCRKKLWVKK